MSRLVLAIESAILASRAVLAAEARARAPLGCDPAGPYAHLPEHCDACTAPPGFPGDDRDPTAIESARPLMHPRAARGIGLGCGGRGMARWCRPRSTANPGCRAWAGRPCPVEVASGDRSALDDARRRSRS